MFVFMQNGTEERKDGTKNGRAGVEPIDGIYSKARRWIECYCKIWIALTHKKYFLLLGSVSCEF